jgi:exonuclease III
MMWLENQTIDVLLLQETHWPFSSDWISGKYMMVHSGSQSKQAGLLCMISTKVCNQSELSWYEHLPGRILQLRIHGPSRCIDILNIYQYTCIPTHMESRSHVWHLLFEILTSFSRRNVLLLAGDFNCSADQRSSAVGYPDFQRNGQRCHGPRHPDANHWRQLLVQFDLTALNTWNAGDHATYEFGDQCSRIDYICTRRTHADSLARDVKYLRDFSLVPISGAFHIPLLTSLRQEWFTAQRTTTTGWTRQQRLKLSQHCLNQDDTYQFFQQQIHQTVTNLLYTSTPDLQTLHNTLNQFTCSSFFHNQPEKGPATEIRPFRQFQDHTRLLRRLCGKELAHIFQAWFHVCKRSQARQAMTIAARQKRKARLDQIFQAADLAEKAHDHFTLFRHIRSLAPKQPLKQILLRSEQGELLGPADAADWLQRWYHDLYSDGDSSFLISDFTWPFTQEEFTQGLQSLPVHKALVPAFTPAPFWKYGAVPISQYLAKMFHDCCDAKDFPDSWSTGTIAMLVKPGKSGRHPSELRPIALLEPTGKTVMGLLTTAIQQQIQPFMNRLPQFAYAVGRGTEDAIHRLTEHCRRVRITLQNFCHPIHNLKQGRDLPSVVGGMTLCLDLTRAFDTVHRQRLFHSLEKLGISSNLISLLKCVYNKTTYEFFHRGTHRSVKTCRGIRQGCRAAPCLWTVFISTLMLDIEQHISPQFLLLCITIFADDICSHQMFDSEESFLTLIKSFGILLDLIEGANLDINLAKTTATLRMRGKLVSKLQKRFLVRTQQGTFIKIPRSNGTYTKIKLVRSFKYLGVMLSYYNFEKETMALRLKHSEQSGHLLHRWLYTQRLSAQQRVKLWYQCIYTCLRYGILATGFNESTLLPFYRFSIKQMRRILRDPVHLSHESNLSFLTRHNLPDPLLRLRDICLQTAARLLHRQGTLADDDVLRLTLCLAMTNFCR